MIVEQMFGNHFFVYYTITINLVQYKNNVMNTINPIFSFLSFEETYAIVGVSKNKKKFGRMVYDQLCEKNYKVLAVNPSMTDVDGKKVYKSLLDIPKDVKRVIIITPKQESATIIQQAVDLGMTHIWLQQMSDTPEAIAIGKNSSAQFYFGNCIFMIAEPVKGIHAFHRSIKQFFGSFPKSNKSSNE